MIRLHFDSKETALLSTFNSPNASLSPLEVGDIHLYHLEHPEIPLIIIERKTIKDLAASIKDGRYKEQIIRLKSIHQHPTRVFFLIEGCHFQNRYLKRISQLGYDNHLYSAFINIMVRDQISILESDDMQIHVEF